MEHIDTKVLREYFVKFKVYNINGKEVIRGKYVQAVNAADAIEEARPFYWNGFIFIEEEDATLVDIVCLGDFRE